MTLPKNRSCAFKAQMRSRLQFCGFLKISQDHFSTLMIFYSVSPVA